MSPTFALVYFCCHDCMEYSDEKSKEGKEKKTKTERKKKRKRKERKKKLKERKKKGSKKEEKGPKKERKTEKRLKERKKFYQKLHDDQVKETENYFGISYFQEIFYLVSSVSTKYWNL